MTLYRNSNIKRYKRSISSGFNDPALTNTKDNRRADHHISIVQNLKTFFRQSIYILGGCATPFPS